MLSMSSCGHANLIPGSMTDTAGRPELLSVWGAHISGRHPRHRPPGASRAPARAPTRAPALAPDRVQGVSPSGGPRSRAGEEEGRLEGPQVCEMHEASRPKAASAARPWPDNSSLHRRTAGEEEEDLEGELEGETRQTASCSNSGACNGYGCNAIGGNLRLLSCLRGCIGGKKTVWHCAARRIYIYMSPIS